MSDCDTCGGTGKVQWMIEGDPNCYQERDSEDQIDCPDCNFMSFAEARDECPASVRDDKKHSWRFDGDDPYVVCHYCGEYRDAITGRVIKRGHA